MLLVGKNDSFLPLPWFCSLFAVAPPDICLRTEVEQNTVDVERRPGLKFSEAVAPGLLCWNSAAPSWYCSHGEALREQFFTVGGGQEGGETSRVEGDTECLSYLCVAEEFLAG